MSCLYLTFADECLYGIESLFKLIGILDGRSCSSYSTQYLSKSGTTQLIGIIREINVVDSPSVPLQYGFYYFLYIGTMSRSGYNHCSRGNHITSVRILLFHRKGVLSGRNIDSQLYGKIRSCLYGFIKSGIFPLVTTRPHPIGGERNARKSIF